MRWLKIGKGRKSPPRDPNKRYAYDNINGGAIISPIRSGIMRPEDAGAKIIAGEAVEDVLVDGFLNLSGETIRGGLRLKDATFAEHLNLRGATFDVEGIKEYDQVFSIRGSVFEGALILGEISWGRDLEILDTVVKRELELSWANIKRTLIIQADVFENLGLFATTIGGSLVLTGSSVEGTLNIHLKDYKNRISVSPNLAQAVSWAAPTTPLVVNPREPIGRSKRTEVEVIMPQPLI